MEIINGYLVLVWSGCLQIVLHLLCYILLFRNLPSFKTERGIFLFHVASFILLATLSAAAWVLISPSEAMFMAGLFVLSLHGIYSMSFLELWSLSQISYSIAILDAVLENPRASIPGLVDKFSTTGSEKKSSRINGLRKLRLIDVSDDIASLTSKGKVVAKALLCLRWIANLRNSG